MPSYICLISVFIRFFLLPTIFLLRLAREGLAKGPWQIFTTLCGTSVAQKLPCVSKYGLQNTTSRADIGVCTVISVGFSGNAGWPPGYEKNIQIGGVLLAFSGLTVHHPSLCASRFCCKSSPMSSCMCKINF